MHTRKSQSVCDLRRLGRILCAVAHHTLGAHFDDFARVAYPSACWHSGKIRQSAATLNLGAHLAMRRRAYVRRKRPCVAATLE